MFLWTHKRQFENPAEPFSGDFRDKKAFNFFPEEKILQRTLCWLKMQFLQTCRHFSARSPISIGIFEPFRKNIFPLNISREGKNAMSSCAGNFLQSVRFFFDSKFGNLFITNVFLRNFAKCSTGQVKCSFVKPTEFFCLKLFHFSLKSKHLYTMRKIALIFHCPSFFWDILKAVSTTGMKKFRERSENNSVIVFCETQISSK